MTAARPAGEPAPMRSKHELHAAIAQRRRAVLMVNTRSRRGQRLYQAAATQLQATGFSLLGSFPVSQPSRLKASLAAALDLQPDLLIAAGGDGTLSLAARHLAYRDTALGILPLGTTNNFARTLGIPMRLTAAIGVLTSGKVADVDLGKLADVDLGEADGVYFANLASTGLSGDVAATARPGLKRLLGQTAYPLTALARLPRHHPFQATITADGQERTLTTRQLNIANGSFHAARPITADASADDRLLLAYSLGGRSRSSLIRATIRQSLLGARRSYAESAFLATGELVLHTTPSLPLVIDGEIHGHTPARITLAPNALRVMVAQDFTDT